MFRMLAVAHLEAVAASPSIQIGFACDTEHSVMALFSISSVSQWKYKTLMQGIDQHFALGGGL